MSNKTRKLKKKSKVAISKANQNNSMSKKVVVTFSSDDEKAKAIADFEAKVADKKVCSDACLVDLQNAVVDTNQA